MRFVINNDYNEGLPKSANIYKKNELNIIIQKKYTALSHIFLNFYSIFSNNFLFYNDFFEKIYKNIG